MKLVTYKNPASKAVEWSKEATVLGAAAILSGAHLSRVDETVELQVVSRKLADSLAHEMLKAAVVDRSVTTTDSQFDPAAIEYRAEVVVIPREAWRGMMNALAQIARTEKVGVDYDFR